MDYRLRVDELYEKPYIEFEYNGKKDDVLKIQDDINCMIFKLIGEGIKLSYNIHSSEEKKKSYIRFSITILDNKKIVLISEKLLNIYYNLNTKSLKTKWLENI